MRDDGVEISFRVNNDGLLQVIIPADGGTTFDLTAGAGSGTILGSVAATAGVIAYGTGVLDTVTSAANFSYDGNALTIGTTLKQASGNLTLGDSTVSANVILSPGVSGRNYVIGTLGSLVVSTATSGQNSVRITGTATNSSIVALAITAVDTFDIQGAGGISGSVTGGDLNLTAGAGFVTGNNNGGNIYLRGGLKNDTGATGNVGLGVQSTDTINFQAMELGCFIADVVTAPTGKPIGGGF